MKKTIEELVIEATVKDIQIVEMGTHDELLEHRGEYKKLYELQFADKEAPQRVAL